MDRNAPATSLTGIPAGLTIAGEVAATEDITIEGRIEGQVSATDHQLSVGPTASVRAKLLARVVTVAGTVEGAILASERVRIVAGATVRGHITTPSLVLLDGAHFTGTVDPERTEAGMLVAKYRQKQSGE
jgi:cytoskeletal protein CcmA (bactofilin family)